MEAAAAIRPELTNERHFTSRGEPRGYIQPQALRELWFHTGTVCNLRCPFCLEGSKPGDARLGRISFQDARPWIDEALALDVQRFSFTGGEPFVVKDLIRILDYALDIRPCFVLTNGTDPLIRRMDEVTRLADKPHPLAFRISLDHPDPERHDRDRGAGNFVKSLGTMRTLIDRGFSVSVARLATDADQAASIEESYREVFRKAGLPGDLRIVAFPEFYRPFADVAVPEITENCMTTYHSQATFETFMCSFSKMVIKKEGRMRVYACTLVDDDPDFDLGGTLGESLGKRVMLKHHRCFSCFSSGSSCSEI